MEALYRVAGNQLRTTTIFSRLILDFPGLSPGTVSAIVEGSFGKGRDVYRRPSASSGGFADGSIRHGL
jgi:hypothetical protein